MTNDLTENIFISDGYLVPIVSSAYVNELIFGSHDSLVQGWAGHIGYPITPSTAESITLAWLSQYSGVDSARTGQDPTVAKQKYINFLKKESEKRAKENWQISQAVRDEVHRELRSLTVSELLRKFNRPCLDEEKNPLIYLADMPLPIYLTTSFHDCLEVVLREVGHRDPQSEICYWHEDLRGIPSVFGPDYTPTKEKPLVLHLFGWDKYPQSLVLTEDDYLDFLANVPHSNFAIPDQVKAHMTLSSVVMLGYQLRDWEFRVVFRGVIRALKRIQGTRIAIQVDEGDVDKAYLEKYLSLVLFDVIWKKPGEFITELSEDWKGGV